MRYKAFHIWHLLLLPLLPHLTTHHFSQWIPCSRQYAIIGSFSLLDIYTQHWLCQKKKKYIYINIILSIPPQNLPYLFLPVLQNSVYLHRDFPDGPKTNTSIPSVCSSGILNLSLSGHLSSHIKHAHLLGYSLSLCLDCGAW